MSSNVADVIKLAMDLREGLGVSGLLLGLSEIDLCLHCLDILANESVTISYLDNLTDFKAELERLHDPTLVTIQDSSNSIVSELSFKPGSFWLIPRTDGIANTSLRLDSQLYSFESQGSESILHEHYAAKGGRVITQFVGNWSPTEGLNITQGEMWDRRLDLMGVELTNGLLNALPYGAFEYDANGAIVGSFGPFPEALDYLAKKLNFTVALATPADGKWGSLEADGTTWNGLMGLLAEGKIDISTAGLAQTEMRMGAADFTVPLLPITTTLIAPTSKAEQTNFWVYLEIFQV